MARSAGGRLTDRHLDHILAFNSAALNNDGPTILANGQGLCSRSHKIKHLPGWKITTAGSQIDWTTPTGHTYQSKRPALIEYVTKGPGHLRLYGLRWLREPRPPLRHRPAAV